MSSCISFTALKDHIPDCHYHHFYAFILTFAPPVQIPKINGHLSQVQRDISKRVRLVACNWTHYESQVDIRRRGTYLEPLYEGGSCVAGQKCMDNLIRQCPNSSHNVWTTKTNLEMEQQRR